MDWTQCIVKLEACVSFLKKEFRDFNQLPAKVNFDCEMDVNQLVQGAKWHKSCHLKFSAASIAMRESGEAAGNSSKRCRVYCQALDKSNCMFCEDDGLLHDYKTLYADQNVRRMATCLQDTSLLTRIKGDDLTALDAKYHPSCLT